jgi:hypothetical protein
MSKRFTTDKASKFFTIERLGPKQSLTPEGFLLCEDVPIGRLGTLQYLPEEVGIAGGPDGIVHISRDENALFSDAALTSFAGKPVTLDHPPGPVTPENWSLFAIGTVMHPRRGEGQQADLMLADLLITAPDVIAAIRAKEIAEVSSGYDCDYEETSPGMGRQLGIIGNHVALVDRGRCGPRCAIGDKEMVVRAVTTNKLRRKLARSTAMDKLMLAISTKDEEASKMALAEVLSGDAAEPDDDDTPGGVHIHMAGPGTDDGISPDMSEVMDAIGEMAARMDDMQECTGDRAMDSRMKDSRMKDAYSKTMDRLKKDRKARDEEKEKAEREAADKRMRDAAEGKNPEDDDDNGSTKDRLAVKDSSSLAAAYQETVSRAEILSPGIRLHTFDARANFKLTQDAMCAMKRRALGNALDNKDLGPIIRPLTGDAPDIKAMSCDKLADMFAGASELVRQHNALDKNRGGAAPGVTQVGAMTFGQQKTPSIAEINARNAKAWN